MDYEKDMKIDETSLDVEWLDQPQLVMKYTRIQAEAHREEEEAKEKLDLVKAQLDKDIRTDPEDFDLGDVPKITEAVVNGAILESDKYKDAFKEWIDAKFENTIAKGAVRAVDTRKASLENLVKLHGQQYFAGPSVPRDLSKEWEKKEKDRRANEKVIIPQRKRRTK